MQAALVQYTREVHTGTLFGYPSRILAALFGFSLSVLAITGPLIWITKQRAKRHGRRVLAAKGVATDTRPAAHELR
jgi:uncharacterized iron-regulated membrane protein